MYNEVVLLGVAVSILFFELTGLSPAGMIVPGYFVLCLQTPQRILYTLVIVLLSLAAVRVLDRMLILYGRRRFALLILFSFALGVGVEKSGLMPYQVSVIGYLVPGIVARECDRQGILRTLACLGIVTGLLALMMLWCGMPVLSL